MNGIFVYPGILLGILFVACYITYKIGVRYGFDNAVKTCSYERIVLDHREWLEAFSLHFQQLARMALEHIRKEHHCVGGDELSELMQFGPKTLEDVRTMQQTIFQLYEKNGAMPKESPLVHP